MIRQYRSYGETCSRTISDQLRCQWCLELPRYSHRTDDREQRQCRVETERHYPGQDRPRSRPGISHTYSRKASHNRDVNDPHSSSQNDTIFKYYGWDAERDQPAGAIPKSVGAQTPAEPSRENADPYKEQLHLRPCDTAMSKSLDVGAASVQVWNDAQLQEPSARALCKTELMRTSDDQPVE